MIKRKKKKAILTVYILKNCPYEVKIGAIFSEYIQSESSVFKDHNSVFKAEIVQKFMKKE